MLEKCQRKQREVEPETRSSHKDKSRPSRNKTKAKTEGKAPKQNKRSHRQSVSDFFVDFAARFLLAEREKERESNLIFTSLVGDIVLASVMHGNQSLKFNTIINILSDVFIYFYFFNYSSITNSTILLKVSKLPGRLEPASSGLRNVTKVAEDDGYSFLGNPNNYV